MLVNLLGIHIMHVTHTLKTRTNSTPHEQRQQQRMDMAWPDRRPLLSLLLCPAAARGHAGQAGVLGHHPLTSPSRTARSVWLEFTSSVRLCRLSMCEKELATCMHACVCSTQR